MSTENDSGMRVGLERLVGRYRAAARARDDVALRHRQERKPYAGIAGLEAARDAYERCARELERTLAGEDPPMADCGWPELERMASFAMRDDIKTELAKMLRHAEIAQSLCSDPIEAMRAYCREIEQLGII